MIVEKITEITNGFVGLSFCLENLVCSPCSADCTVLNSSKQEKKKTKEKCSTYSFEKAPFSLCKNRLALHQRRSICFSRIFRVAWQLFSRAISSVWRIRHWRRIFCWAKKIKRKHWKMENPRKIALHINLIERSNVSWSGFYGLM